MKRFLLLGGFLLGAAFHIPVAIADDHMRSGTAIGAAATITYTTARKTALTGFTSGSSVGGIASST